MRAFLRLISVILTLLSAPAMAQDTAALVSDRLLITGTSTLVAEGNVEIFFQGRKLKASRISYDQATDRLLIEGPIVLTEETGQTIILADQADLAADLSNGILTSARMVLNQQLQLAANRMMRVDGRYTALDNVVASSCTVCASNPIPVWEIRARRVVHDQEERQLYFDHAQFRLAGVPVFYFPRLRMPDPTLDRANGFLRPSLRTTSELGSGLKFPYFITFGDSRDLTLTPYLTTRGGRTLELRYRQAFATGGIEIEGAFSRDGILPGEDRGYVFAKGAFDLPAGFGLDLKLQTVSDPAYLLDYGILNTDRLDSRITVSRTRRNEHISGRIISFQTLRDDEDNNTIPSVVSDLTFHRRFSLGPLGGEGGLRLQTHSHWRSSESNLDSDGDGISDGRDMQRISARIDWRRSFLLPMGIEATILGEASGDAFVISQEPAPIGGDKTRTHAAAGVELRWPWVKAAQSGAVHVIEPVVQLVWAGTDNAGIPNEDSRLVEFDEGNLFSLNRFPGSDEVELGRRANIGVTWTRHDPAGWTMGVTLGRVYREKDYTQFGRASGLDGETSDWLAGTTFTLGNGYAIAGRATFDDSFDLSKAEARISVNRERLALATSMLYVVSDPLENRPDPTREFAFDAAWKATDQLTAKISGSYDFEAERGTLAALGLEYRTDCLAVDVSLSRRFTSSTSVTPTTDIGLSVALIGFGSGENAGVARRCR